MSRIVLAISILISLQCLGTRALPTAAKSNSSETLPPVVIWHGITDGCCDPEKTQGGYILNLIQTQRPQLPAYSIKIGSNLIEERTLSILDNVNFQITAACEYIASLPDAKNGYNAVGLSQGGQFFRAVAQRCPSPPMINLITLGSQHQGVFGIPECDETIGADICDYVRKMLEGFAYSEVAQNTIVPAQYWNNPLDQDTFTKKSAFIAEINNIAEGKFNETYKTNLQRLQNFVMVKFIDDKVVVPVESSWFGYYASGNTNAIISMQQSDIYQKDTIGLQELDKAGKLHLVEVAGGHVQIDDSWFLQEIVDKYLLKN